MSYKAFTKNILIIVVTNVIFSLRSLILLPIITKHLGDIDYGIWAQIVVTISLVSAVLTVGLPYTLVRFLAAEKDKKIIRESLYSVLFLIVGITFFISLLFSLFSVPASQLLGMPSDFILIMCLIILFESANLVLLHIFRAFQEITKYSIFLIILGFGELIFSISAIFLGYGIIGATFSLLLIRLIIFFILLYIMLKRYGFSFPKFNLMPQFLSFGIPTLAVTFSAWMIHSVDRYLIGFFMGPKYVGYYYSGYILAGIVSLYEAPLSFVLPSVLSKIYDENGNKTDEVKIYLKYSLKYLLLISIPSIFGISVLGMQLLFVLATYDSAKNAFLTIPFLAVGLVFYGLHGVFFQIINLVKKTAISGRIWLFTALFHLILNIILIPRIGILGAAIASTISYFIMCSLTWHYAFKYFNFHIDWDSIIKSLLVSTLMALLIFKINPDGLWQSLACITGGAMFYALAMIILKVFKKNEIDFFIGLIRDSRKLYSKKI